jgi:type I restriction enzyme S subunit
MNTKLLGDFDVYINDGNYGEIYPDKELFLDSGIPFISATDFRGRIFNYEGIKFISEDLHFKVLKKGQLRLNDILIVVRGNGIGKVGFFKDKIGECNINAQLAFIRCNPEEINPLYLYYLLSSESYLSIIKRFGSGSAQPQLPINRLKLVPINYPTLSTQQKIASVLSALDSKIELNNRINAELEAMAKTLYDYWFVQFDFPDKNGKPYKTSGGKMVWNDELKREIPEGWEVVTVDNYAEVKKGELITAKDAKEGSVKVVAAGIDYSYFHSSPNRLKNTITISGSGANAGFINFWREPIFASDCITVRGKSDAETLILLQYLNFIQPHILRQATGSAQPHVYPSDIKILNYVVPPDLLIVNYGKMMIPMNDKIGNNEIENQKLTELQDWLLPMLMNGQVKVMDEKETELSMAAEAKTKYWK